MANPARGTGNKEERQSAATLYHRERNCMGSTRGRRKEQHGHGGAGSVELSSGIEPARIWARRQLLGQ